MNRAASHVGMPRRPISRIARRLSNDSRTRTLRCAKKSIRHRCSRRSLELLPFYRRYSLSDPKPLPPTPARLKENTERHTTKLNTLLFIPLNVNLHVPPFLSGFCPAHS